MSFKSKGIILMVVSGGLLLLFLPKLLYSMVAIIAALAGKLNAGSPYQSGRVVGVAVSSLVVYGLLIWLMVYGIKLIRPKIKDKK